MSPDSASILTSISAYWSSSFLYAEAIAASTASNTVEASRFFSAERWEMAVTNSLFMRFPLPRTGRRPAPNKAPGTENAGAGPRPAKEAPVSALS